MSSSRRTAVLGTFGLLMLIGSAGACAQNAGTLHYEYKEKIDQARNISPLGLDLFGDATNFENGSTQFKHQDLELPTSVRVKVPVGRVFRVGVSRELQGADVPSGDIFGLGWSPDIPYIKGDFIKADGWIAQTGINGSTGRCSSGNFAPGAKHIYTKVVLAHNFFFGNDINIPGQGTERLLALRADGARPTDGAAYVGTTTSNWKVSCLPTVMNGPGEGFIVTIQDGTKYYFNWMASRDTGIIPFTYEDLSLSEYRLYATKAVDRFGGEVNYTYDAANPHRISSITTSDGSTLNFTYDSVNGKVSTVTTAGRTWQYQYTPISSQRVYDQLSRVILPDGSSWVYNSYPYQVSGRTGSQPCLYEVGTRSSSQSPGTNEASTMSITHPSGAVGQFKFRALMFGYNRTPDKCYAPVASPTAPNTPYRPKAFIVNSLYEKTISGPGLTTILWTMRYYPSWSYGYECGACATTARTVVTSSEGETRTYVFGNDYTTNASQHLSLTVSKSGKTRQETYTYLANATGQAFPDQIGEDRFQINNNAFLLKNRPKYISVLSQDGRDFKTTVEQFDYLARPTRLRKENYATPAAPPTDPGPGPGPICPGCQIP